MANSLTDFFAASQSGIEDERVWNGCSINHSGIPTPRYIFVKKYKTRKNTNLPNAYHWLVSPFHPVVLQDWSSKKSPTFGIETSNSTPTRETESPTLTHTHTQSCHLHRSGLNSKKALFSSRTFFEDSGLLRSVSHAHQWLTPLQNSFFYLDGNIIWRFPETVVPPYHPFSWHVPLHKPSILGYPHVRPPHVISTSSPSSKNPPRNGIVIPYNSHHWTTKWPIPPVSGPFQISQVSQVPAPSTWVPARGLHLCISWPEDEAEGSHPNSGYHSSVGGRVGIMWLILPRSDKIVSEIWIMLLLYPVIVYMYRCI